MNDANAKLKADLKKATDELNELKKQADLIRNEALKYSETQTLIMMYKNKEEEYK